MRIPVLPPLSGRAGCVLAVELDEGVHEAAADGTGSEQIRKLGELEIWPLATNTRLVVMRTNWFIAALAVGVASIVIAAIAMRLS